MQLATTKSKFRSLRSVFAAAVAVPAIAVLSSPAAMAAGETIETLTTGATTEMAPVKAAMITVGVVLVGIAALSFAIYKIVGMAKGRG